MENQIDERTIGYTFQWKIEGISHCWLKKGEGIKSPTFIADALHGTKWSLLLYPMGDGDENYVGLFLLRERVSNGPLEINVEYQLSIVGKNDRILTKPTAKNTFSKIGSWGNSKFEERGKIFVAERNAFLPEDTLTVLCTIWCTGEKPVKQKYFYARTIFNVNRGSFVWRINKFSTLKSIPINKFKNDLIEFDLALNEGLDTVKNLVINIDSFDEKVKYFSFKPSVINSEGKRENCGDLEYFADDLKRGKSSSLQILIKKLMVNKSQYLPNEVLSLNCEYVISTLAHCYEFFESVITSANVSNEVDKSAEEQNVEKETPFLNKDLKSMYSDAIFSDSELRTSTRTFPVHKAVLSSRSPVFRRMFSNNMKENNTGHVDITNIEDDTVHRMLLYMYTDSLEDLQIESACKLYAAADKYAIFSLKSGCSSFLRGNLSPTKACAVLLLAEQHQDNDLKCFVKNYIIEHGKEVFLSQEWKDFMDIDLELAADIMYTKVCLV